MNAIKKCIVSNVIDNFGNPAGGFVEGVGLRIDWQNGPLGRHANTCEAGKPCTVESGCTRQEPNGAFVETVISAAVKRIEFYQASKFKSRENAIALTHLETALLWLNKRTQDREERQVEGTHTV